MRARKTAVMSSINLLGIFFLQGGGYYGDIGIKEFITENSTVMTPFDDDRHAHDVFLIFVLIFEVST